MLFRSETFLSSSGWGVVHVNVATASVLNYWEKIITPVLGQETLSFGVKKLKTN